MTRGSDWGWTMVSPTLRGGGPQWLRIASMLTPWITVGVLLLMLNMISSVIALGDGMLLELPETDYVIGDAEATPLVALVMRSGSETLIYFDDSRYSLDDESSYGSFLQCLSSRAESSSSKTLLLLADRQVNTGEMVRILSKVRKVGVNKVLFANRRVDASAEGDNCQ